MNNSFLAIENASLQVETPVDVSPLLREREGELITIIEAIRTIKDSDAWNILKDKIFGKLEKSLTKELTEQARQQKPDTLDLSYTSGQLTWAEKYADLQKLENVYRAELKNIRLKLHGTT